MRSLVTFCVIDYIMEKLKLYLKNLNIDQANLSIGLKLCQAWNNF